MQRCVLPRCVRRALLGAREQILSLGLEIHELQLLVFALHPQQVYFRMLLHERGALGVQLRFAFLRGANVADVVTQDTLEDGDAIERVRKAGTQ